MTSGIIYFILFGAEVLKGFSLVMVMLIALIILGCFMDSLSMFLVVVPFLWPVLVEINGGDYATADTAAFAMNANDLKIWFGILALIVIELGLITPPVGLNVFIINALAGDVKMADTFKGVMPFFGVELIRIALILVFPAVALFVPRLLSG